VHISRPNIHTTDYEWTHQVFAHLFVAQRARQPVAIFRNSELHVDVESWNNKVETFAFSNDVFLRAAAMVSG
jgi:hypothetical protein